MAYSGNLDNILPKNMNTASCEIPAISSLLNDLQSGLEWNICTTKNNDGGYCIKFNTNQDPCQQSGASRSDEESMVNKFLRIDINPVRPSTSQQKQDICGDLELACPEEPKESPSKPVAAKPSMSTNKVEPGKEVSKKVVEETKAEDGAAVAVKEEPAEQPAKAEIEGVKEALESQKDSGRPAMLVCVLLGPSMELMKISNVVQEMAKENDVTVRMNAPMH